MRKRRSERLAAERLKSEKERLIEEVRAAEAEWRLAHIQFDAALGADQVDYAIYLLEAAEQKLDMTLRRARKLWEPGDTVQQWPELRLDAAVVGSEGA